MLSLARLSGVLSQLPHDSRARGIEIEATSLANLIKTLFDLEQTSITDKTVFHDKAITDLEKARSAVGIWRAVAPEFADLFEHLENSACAVVCFRRYDVTGDEKDLDRAEAYLLRSGEHHGWFPILQHRGIVKGFLFEHRTAESIAPDEIRKNWRELEKLANEERQLYDEALKLTVRSFDTSMLRNNRADSFMMEASVLRRIGDARAVDRLTSAETEIQESLLELEAGAISFITAGEIECELVGHRCNQLNEGDKVAALERIKSHFIRGVRMGFRDDKGKDKNEFRKRSVFQNLDCLGGNAFEEVWRIMCDPKY